MNRKLSLILALIVTAVMAFSGCQPAATTAPSTTAQTSTTTTSQDREPYEFTILVNYDWFTPPGEWGTDVISKQLSDMFKLKINWVGSGGNPNDKIATMLASDQLPESIILERDASYLQLIELGKLVSLDDYITKYPGYKSNVDETTRKMSAINDKIYAVLNWPTTQPNGNNGWVVNTKVYDQLGKPELKTLDQLYTYLKAVKDAGIKENGADVVPLQFGAGMDFTQMYAAYGEGRVRDYYNKRAWINSADKKFEFIGKDPKFTDMMLFMQKLYSEGLINQDIFIEQQDQVKEKMANGRFALATGEITSYMLQGLNIWKETAGTRYFDAINPISESGDHTSVYSSTWNSLGWNAQCITTAATKPERIFEYYDYLSSNEGQILVEYGPKGELWDQLDEKGYPIYKDPNAEISEADTTRLGLWYWVYPGITVITDNSKVAANNRKPVDKQDIKVIWQSTITWKHSWNATEFTGMDPAGDSEAGIAFKAVDDLFKEYLPKIIGAKSADDAKNLIAELNTKAEEAGFVKTLDFYNTTWQANLARMGK